MASIHSQPGRPHYFCAFTDSNGVRRFKSTKTGNRKEAQKIANAFEKTAKVAARGPLSPDRARKIVEDFVAEIAEESGTVLERHTIKSYFENWIRGREHESSEGTHTRYKGIVELFLKFLAEDSRKSLQSLDSEQIQEFRDDLAGKVSSGTVNTYLKVLRVALNKAVKKNLIDRNPAASVDNLDRSDKHTRKPFKLDQVKKLLEIAEPDWETMILNSYYTGMRLSDIANLTAEHLDFLNEQYTFKEDKGQDGGRERTIVIAKPLLRHLEKLPLGDNPTAPLCPTLLGKSESWLSGQFWELMAKAGIVASRKNHQSQNKGRDRRRTQSALTFHSLRHTATTSLKSAGVSDAIARDIIGHESVAVSQNYTHIDDATKREALEKLPDLTA